MNVDQRKDFGGSTETWSVSMQQDVVKGPRSKACCAELGRERRRYPDAVCRINWPQYTPLSGRASQEARPAVVQNKVGLHAR